MASGMGRRLPPCGGSRNTQKPEGPLVGGMVRDGRPGTPRGQPPGAGRRAWRNSHPLEILLGSAATSSGWIVCQVWFPGQVGGTSEEVPHCTADRANLKSYIRERSSKFHCVVMQRIDWLPRDGAATTWLRKGSLERSRTRNSEEKQKGGFSKDRVTRLRAVDVVIVCCVGRGESDHRSAMHRASL